MMTDRQMVLALSQPIVGRKTNDMVKSIIWGRFEDGFPIELSGDYAKFLDTNTIYVNNESMVTFCMIWALKRLPEHLMDPEHLIAPDLRDDTPVVCSYADAFLEKWDSFFPEAEEAFLAKDKLRIGPAVWDGTGSPDRELAKGVQPGHFRRLTKLMKKGRSWLIDLVAARQTRQIRSADISAYFYTLGISGVQGRIVLDVVEYSSLFLPKVTDVRELRKMVTRAAWIDVRFGFVYTAEVVIDMMQSCRKLIEALFSSVEINGIEKIAGDRFSLKLVQAIPHHITAAAYAFMVTHRTLPTCWFQAMVAIDNIPDILSTGYLIAFRWAAEAKSITSVGLKGLPNPINEETGNVETL